MLGEAFALILGILAGTFTGLAPGIHINLIAALVLSKLEILPFNHNSLVIFIVSMSMTHTFLDFIPSIFLGAPEENTFLSILPGHQMLKEGSGQAAVVITLYGCLFALILILIATPIFIFGLNIIYSKALKIMPFLLIFFSVYLVLREENIILGMISFILAGFLGFSAFSIPVKDPLLPLLSGLFGTSSLIISLKDKNAQIPQKIIKLREISLKKKELFKASIASLFTPLFSFFPGIGSGHAATFSSEIVPQERKGFLFLTGVASTTMMGLSFVTLYALDKTRSGTAAAVKEILKEISFSNLITIIFTIIISGILAFIIGINIANLFGKYIQKINYKKLNFIVLGIIILVNILFTNLLGIVLLFISTIVGLYILNSGSRRINLMGALILPTIIYYLTF